MSDNNILLIFPEGLWTILYQKRLFYISVKNAILKAIQSGEFNSNTQLPTEKILS